MLTSPTNAPPPYKYRCVDKSWLTGVLAATVVPQIEDDMKLIESGRVGKDFIQLPFVILQDVV